MFGKAAHANADAAYHVGRCYIEGKVVPVSFAYAAQWLQRAASRGHREAQALFAELLLHGRAHSTDADTSPQVRGGLFASNQVGEPDFSGALVWSRRAAEAGSADGQALLAYLLTRGPDTLRDLDAGRNWYERAAAGGSAQGHLGFALAIADQAGREPETVSHLRQAADKGLPAATYLLGVVTEHGVGTAADLAAAGQYYRKAAEAGHHAAQSRWGAMLMDGIGIPCDPEAGETWLRRAAVAGEPNAAARVGQIYATAGALPPNYAEAANWFERAARAGHRGAAHALGVLYLSGSGVPLDAEEAARWFRVAASAGSASAQSELARLVLKGKGNASDLASMLLWFRTGADAGDHVAEFNYAVCLAKGVGCQRDDVEAARYLRRAARYVTSARYWYGLMVAEGRGVAENLAKARRHFLLAVAEGQPEAATALGEMLINGKGGPRDSERAVTLFRSAAANKHAGAMFALGVVHSGGHDIPADLTVARAWLLAAAHQNHAPARRILGQWLTDGVGGDKDLEQARYWLEGGASGIAETGIAHAPESPSRVPVSGQPVMFSAPAVDPKATIGPPADPVVLPPVPPDRIASRLSGSVTSTAAKVTPALIPDKGGVTVAPGTSVVSRRAQPEPSPSALPRPVVIPAPAPIDGPAPGLDPDWIVVTPAEISGSRPGEPEAIASAGRRDVVSLSKLTYRPAPGLNPDWIVAVPSAADANPPEQPRLIHSDPLRWETVRSAPPAERSVLTCNPGWVVTVAGPAASLESLPAPPRTSIPTSAIQHRERAVVELSVPVRTFARGRKQAVRVAAAAAIFFLLGDVNSWLPDPGVRVVEANGSPWPHGSTLLAPATPDRELPSTKSSEIQSTDPLALIPARIATAMAVGMPLAKSGGVPDQLWPVARIEASINPVASTASRRSLTMIADGIAPARPLGSDSASLADGAPAPLARNPAAIVTVSTLAKPHEETEAADVANPKERPPSATRTTHVAAKGLPEPPAQATAAETAEVKAPAPTPAASGVPEPPVAADAEGMAAATLTAPAVQSEAAAATAAEVKRNRQRQRRRWQRLTPSLTRLG
jgi:TPR repeat protein